MQTCMFFINRVKLNDIEMLIYTDYNILNTHTFIY